jgi:hypothetical protein
MNKHRPEHTQLAKMTPSPDLHIKKLVRCAKNGLIFLAKADALLILIVCDVVLSSGDDDIVSSGTVGP